MITFFFKQVVMKNHCGITKLSNPDLLMPLNSDFLMRIRKKYPQSFDTEACLELERLIAMPAIEFKKQRTPRHLLKIAYSHYFIQRDLLKANKVLREKRHLKMHTVRAHLEYPFGKKSVLGLILGVSLKERYECLEQDHILQSVTKYLPDIHTVQRSYYSYHDSYENFRLIYLEIEKEDGTSFSTKELSILHRALPQELERRVEKLTPTLFTTHNEEEIIKNILVLSRELRYVNDLSQVMIFFESQSTSELIFSVIITRILRKGMAPWSDVCLKPFSGQAKCLQVHSQIIGYLRKNYPKEAIILRLQLPKDTTFLRMDSSINLYMAREKVSSLLHQMIGKFRDYNGGIILKRLELLSQLKQSFKKESALYLDFLENIFYSITPIEMQAISALKPLEILIELFFEGIQQPLSQEKEYFYKVREEQDAIFIFFRAEDSTAQSYLNGSLEKTTSMTSAALISATTYFQGSWNVGYIYYETCLEKRREFLQAIVNGIQAWHQKVYNAQVLRLSVLSFPLSLDPRLGGDEVSGNILRMLYEGLMRIGPDGMPIYGIAHSFSLSKDAKQYLFQLRDAYWSNGTPLSAYDFEYAWKKILSPKFKTAFTYLFYPIKNGKLAKEGLVPPEEIGVKALDEKTLRVDLEVPTPYFLELTTHTLYSPVNHVIDTAHPDWAYLEGKSYVCNGPFRLEKLSPGHSYELVKNESYWDKPHVNLDKIFIFKSTPHKALERFRNNEIDWLGRPLCNWEPYFSSQQWQHHPSLSAGLYWCICNTTRFPFNHFKIRQALAYAIHRKEIIKALSYDGLPAVTPLPFIHTFNIHDGVTDRDISKAQQLFEEALHELGLTRENFPSFTLIHINREVKEKIAKMIAQQWKDVLGISCHIEAYEWRDLFSKMSEGDYDLGAMGWTATIDNPLYILDIFKNKDNPINFSRWEHVDYLELLNQAVQQGGEGVDRASLVQAEKILLQEFPIIPIFYEIERYEKQGHLRGINLSKVGNIDFKSAYILKKEKRSDC
ncbi:MAG: peptide ABC transporter substrate-binding protein [Rhabdochlamydiaceae bacterium]